MYSALVEGRRAFLFEGSVQSFVALTSGLSLRLPDDTLLIYKWDEVSAVYVKCDDMVWSISARRAM